MKGPPFHTKVNNKKKPVSLTFKEVGTVYLGNNATKFEKTGVVKRLEVAFFSTPLGLKLGQSWSRKTLPARCNRGEEYILQILEY